MDGSSSRSSVLNWDKFQLAYPAGGVDLLVSPLEAYNVYRSLATCGKFQQISTNWHSRLQLLYLVCSTTPSATEPDDTVHIIVPLSAQSSVSAKRLHEFCALDNIGGEAPGARETMVRLAVVDKDGLMVFLQLQNYLCAPSFKNKE